MTRFVLAIDQGTTSSRAILFDSRGRPVASAQQEFRQHFPHPGWVEHDPRDLWDTSRGAALAALRKAGAGRGDIAAVGIANQRETTLLWERATGRPIHRAIVWQDRRTAGGLRLARAGGSRAPVQAQDGPPARPLFLGDEDLLDPGPRPRRAPQGRPGRARVRDRRHLAALEAHGGPRARHGRVERLAHAPRRPGHGRLGRRAGPGPAHAAGGPPRYPAEQRGLRRDRRDRGPARRSRGRDRRGPAGGPLRPGMLPDAGWPRTPTGPGASCS